MRTVPPKGKLPHVHAPPLQSQEWRGRCSATSSTDSLSVTESATGLARTTTVTVPVTVQTVWSQVLVTMRLRGGEGPCNCS